MVSNHAVWGWKAPVKASVSGVSSFSSLPFSFPSFPLSPRNSRLVVWWRNPLSALQAEVPPVSTTKKRIKPVELSYMLEVKINYDERETMEKSYRTTYSLHFESQIKKESFSLLSQLNFGDFVMEMQWAEGLAVVNWQRLKVWINQSPNVKERLSWRWNTWRAIIWHK